MALHLWASMDALVASSSSEGFVGIFPGAQLHLQGGVMLPDLVVTAMGEMVVGILSRDASAISALTWDEVSTG